jgi:hypothetical protein
MGIFPLHPGQRELQGRTHATDADAGTHIKTGTPPGQNTNGDVDRIFEDRVEQDYLADRQLAHDERQRRAGQGTAGSSFGRAAAAIDAAASSDETASERDDDDDPQDFYVDDQWFEVGPPERPILTQVLLCLLVAVSTDTP